jgi:ascorbate-specific PTS system EIIC-type component UlaA
MQLLHRDVQDVHFAIDHPQSFASILSASLDETLAKYESAQRLTSEAKTMPSTIEE